MNRFAGWARRFARNERGNVAILFAFASLPMALGIAGALEVSQFHRMKGQVQEAANNGALLAMHARRDGSRAMHEAAQASVDDHLARSFKGQRAHSELSGTAKRRSRTMLLTHRVKVTLPPAATGLRSFVSEVIEVEAHVLDKRGDGVPPRLVDPKGWITGG